MEMVLRKACSCRKERRRTRTERRQRKERQRKSKTAADIYDFRLASAIPMTLLVDMTINQ